jgi:hypothetical protein
MPCPSAGSVEGETVSIEAIAVCLHHSRASGTDKLVLLGIANHEGDGGAWPSVGTLARYANCTERNVQRSIANLIELGEVQVERQAGGNDGTRQDRRPNLYRVTVRCPGSCDGTSRHRVRGDAHDTPSRNGVTSTVARGDAHVANGVTPTSPEPSLQPSGKPLPATPRQKDILFESVAECCGIALGSITRTSRGALNRAVKELREVDATPDQVANVAKAYKANYPNATLTPMALVKHWASFGTPKRAAEKSVWDTYERPEWY